MCVCVRACVRMCLQTYLGGCPSSLNFPSICMCIFTRSVGLAINWATAPAVSPLRMAFLNTYYAQQYTRHHVMTVSLAKSEYLKQNRLTHIYKFRVPIARSGCRQTSTSIVFFPKKPKGIAWKYKRKQIIDLCYCNMLPNIKWTGLVCLINGMVYLYWYGQLVGHQTLAVYLCVWVY